jgi:hypothetical protein
MRNPHQREDRGRAQTSGHSTGSGAQYRRRRNALVGLSHLPALEEHLIGSPGGGLLDEYDDPGRRTIEPMGRCDVGIIATLTKTHQSSGTKPHATWRGRQKMRLVNHDDPLILIEDTHLKRDIRLVDDPTVMRGALIQHASHSDVSLLPSPPQRRRHHDARR